jgi:hypothetical protein
VQLKKIKYFTIILVKIMFFRNVMMFNLIARNLLSPSSGQKMEAAVSSRTIPVYFITCITSQKTIPLLLIALVT